MRFGLLPAATLALFLGAALITPRARGDIAFIGANADAAEHFAFVALSSYASGTVLNFTDAGYGTNVSGLETKFRWTEHFVAGGPLSLTLSTTLSLGQVVIFDATDGRFERPGGAAYGTTSGVAMSLGTTSIPADNIFAYRGTVTEDVGTTEAYRGDTSGVTSFEGALAWGGDGANGPWQTNGVGDSAGSYLPATPNTPFNFADVTLRDNVRYNGARTFASVGALKAALTTASNWAGSDTTATSTAGFGGDFVVAVPEASAAAFGALAGLGVLARRLWRGRPRR